MNIRKIEKPIAVSLAMLLSLSSLAGCGREEEPADTVTKIAVTTQELVPELTDEDLGITRIPLDKLSKIDTYQSWSGYNFLVLEPATADSEDHSQRVTVQIEDEDLYDALYDAKNAVYLDVEYTSIDPSDEVYSFYALGLRSLGSHFYEFSGMEEIKDERPPYVLSEGTKEVVASLVENIDDKTLKVSSDSASGLKEGDIIVCWEGATPHCGKVKSTEDGAVILDISEGMKDACFSSFGEDASTEAKEPASEQSDDTAGSKVIFTGWEDTEEVAAQKKYKVALQAAVDEYLSSISLNRATKLVVCDLEGASLGEVSATKLKDYLAAHDIEDREYEAEGGVVYLSDVEDGYDYAFMARLEDGQYYAEIKNDTDLPLEMTITTENAQKKVAMFKEYAPTIASVNAQFSNDTWAGSGTDEAYSINVRYYNSDADLAAALEKEEENSVAHLAFQGNGVIAPGKETPSTYQAFINDTDTVISVSFDTGDGMFMQPGEAIGVHAAAYSTFEWSAQAEGEE